MKILNIKMLNIYGIAKDNKSTKFNKYKQIKNIIQKLTTETNYDLCFSHMSPLLIVLTTIFSKTKKIPTVLWYTHPKPKEFSKKIILLTEVYFLAIRLLQPLILHFHTNQKK